MKFLVIGGDAAGMSAASRAKRNNPNLEVTVLEKTMDVSYSACGMPYNIADTSMDMDVLVVRKAQVFRQKQGIDLLTGHKALHLDPQKKEVQGQDIQGTPFSFLYDTLLIATGASPIIPDLPGMDLPGVLPLKSLEDGRKIKSYLAENTVKKALIVGMGYIGLEMCEALVERGVEVSMIRRSNDFIPWLDKDICDYVRQETVNKGVGLYFNQGLKKIEKKSMGLCIETDSMSFDADLVILALGVVPNSDMAEKAGLELGRNKEISVSRALESSHDHIYAAGDCADAFHVVTGQKTWIPLALRANRAGWAVADSVCGNRVELPGIAGTAVFKLFDLQVARTGLTVQEAVRSGFDAEQEVIKTRSRAHGQPGSTDIWVQIVGDKKTNRLLGLFMVGKEGVAHRINAPAVALSARMTVLDYIQSDLAYAPPFGPVWDPTLTAAIQLSKKLT
ncbi:MAG: FAD-dependent oxidoreductase [Proteobacteria bacterium]|nr:FAD-dependent oxidoreductase [Pseudomonadota bacterium]